MSVKEIRIEHSKIKDPQKITQVQEKAFEEAGLSMHRDELTHEEIIDDHDKKVRVLKVRGRRKYFFLGGK
ncbi:MAG: hypothetical protein U1E51_22975 [Candidatus Binatia bacterium]|nr:hypothetical protein [Candidatus Binatia bacterium]